MGVEQSSKSGIYFNLQTLHLLSGSSCQNIHGEKETNLKYRRKDKKTEEETREKSLRSIYKMDLHTLH